MRPAKVRRSPVGRCTRVVASPLVGFEVLRADQATQVDQVARVIRASLGRGGSRVTLQLEPEDLGPLRIQMQLRGGNLTAHFETQTEAARSWVQQNLGQLHDALSANGVRLVDATVEHRGADGQPLGGQAGQSGHQGNLPGDNGGGRQGASSRQHLGGWSEAVETDVPSWAAVAASSDQLNVVA